MSSAHTQTMPGSEGRMLCKHSSEMASNPPVASRESDGAGPVSAWRMLPRFQSQTSDLLWKCKCVSYKPPSLWCFVGTELGIELSAASHGPVGSVGISWTFVLWVCAVDGLPGWPVLPPYEVPAPNNALCMFTLVTSTSMNTVSSGNLDGKGQWAQRQAALCNCFYPSSPALIWDVEMGAVSTCSLFLGSTEHWASTVCLALFSPSAFSMGPSIWVPSWPLICTTQPGEVAKKSELLECSGPQNITLRGSFGSCQDVLVKLLWRCCCTCTGGWKLLLTLLSRMSPRNAGH